MYLNELLFGIQYKLRGVGGNIEVTRPCCDSRAVTRGSVFICIRGMSTDGELYIEEAMAAGAACIVAEKEYREYPCCVVNDSRYALAVMWNNYYRDPARGMRLFGITGTNGKTSTAEFLSAILKNDRRRVGVIGTLGCFADGEMIDCAGSEKVDAAAAMTTPDPEYLYGVLEQFRKRGVSDTVMEVSSHAIVQRKIDALRFYMGIFTNLSPEHLDCHGTMEEYFRVKASFVSRCRIRIVNADSPECRRFALSVPSEMVGGENIRDVSVFASRVSYILEYKGKRLNIKSSVGGDFTVSNTLLASVAALCAGVPERTVEKGIASVVNVRGRLERIVKKEEDGFDLFIDYAHTPVALECVLLGLRKVCKGRLICVFGCGGDRDRQKRPVMGKIAETLCDGVIVTSDNSRKEDSLSIIRDIVGGMGGENSVVIPSRKEAVFAAVSMAGNGDIVLLAGKGHETYEIGKDGKTKFDEREIVKEALRTKNCK